MSADRIGIITKAICQSGKFESGHGTCAFLCMSGLGDVRKSGCEYHQRIHGDLAKQIADALAEPVVAKEAMDALRWNRDQLCEGFCRDLPDAGTYTPDMDDHCSGCRSRVAIAKAEGRS